jgi:hypothetical protein
VRYGELFVKDESWKVVWHSRDLLYVLFYCVPKMTEGKWEIFRSRSPTEILYQPLALCLLLSQLSEWFRGLLTLTFTCCCYLCLREVRSKKQATHLRLVLRWRIHSMSSVNPILKRCPFRWQCPVSSPTTQLNWSLFNFNRSFVLLAEGPDISPFACCWFPTLELCDRERQSNISESCSL